MSYSSEVLADSPTGYWPLDEVSGTTITDSVAGLVLNGTGTYTFGTPSLRSNAGIDFAAAGSFTNFTPGSAYVWSLGTDFTLEFLIRRDSTVATVQSILGCRTNITTNNQFGVYFLATNAMSFDVGLTNNRWTLPVNQSISDTNWHHVVLRHRGSDGFRDYWLDGSLQVIGTMLPATASASAGPLGIGISATATAFNGALDEVAIYNGKFLADARIQAHWAQIAPILMGGTSSMMGI